ncbi:hypothetical protein Tco_1238606 [Tanacetum coccineum]
MCTYLENMEGKKPKDLKNKFFDSIQKMFDNAFKRVNTFVDFKTDLVKGSSKRAGIELEQEVTKKQKVDDVQETAKVDNNQEVAKIKELMEIIPNKEEVAIDAIPLAVKPPSIVDWKIHKEGKKTYCQIIKADGTKHGSTRPNEGYEKVLWGDLKGRIVGIKSFLMLFGITTVLIDVNAAQSKLVLLENFNENYSKCLRLLYKVNAAEGVNAASEEVSTAELEVILFYNGLDVPTRQILDSKGVIPTKTAANAKVAIQEMAEYSQKWHNGTSRTRSTETSNRLVAIQAQLNNLEREIKKVNEKVYVAQVGCEQCKGRHHTKDCPLKEEGKTLEEAYYTQFGAPFQQGGQYRAAALGFYQRNNENPSNQGASIKTLEIQIGKMSKVLQERGFGSPPRSTETHPRDHVKSISTTVEADMTPIRRIRESQYAVSTQQNRASVSVMPLLNYLNLGLGELAHTKLMVELADRIVKYPKGIAENVLVGIELRRDQVDDLMPTIEESKSSTILKDKFEYKGKNVVGAFMNIPIFVGKFSVVTYFPVVENMDGYRDQDMGDVIVGEPFCKASCVEARRFDGLITIHNGNDNVTYQMARSYPRFRHLSNAQCKKIKPLLKVSWHDKLDGILHSYQKLKRFYKGILNLGPKYIRDAKMEEWLTRGHVSVHEMK